MCRWIRMLGIALAIGGAVGTFAPSRAMEAGAPQDESYPVSLRVGDTFQVCNSGQILCPAVSPICDDVRVAAPVDTPGGLGFQGIAPGTTLCSAASSTGQRRVFRITVR